MTLTVGSLFSGIGGIDLGLERAGMTVKWHSEIDPFACRVLKKHWPHVPNIGDITQVDWEQIPYVDVIAGGYPCQPFSLAGKRAGDNDPRHLWPYFRNAISVLRPRYALLENVRGHLSMGGLSVIGDLAALGYDAEWRIVSAASVGANHRRDRLIIVAYPNSRGMERERAKQSSAGIGGKGAVLADSDDAGSGTPGDGIDGEWSSQSEERHRVTFGGFGGRGSDVADSSIGNVEELRLREVYGQTAKLRERDCDGRSVGDWWQTEPDVGRVAHGVPSRVDRLRGIGNAVVPQVAEVIGRLIMEHAHD
jgi:DNA (cytosine-5)-methyltransferase 1